MYFVFVTPVEKQAHLDALKLTALNKARNNVFETIQNAPECRFELTFENSEISFIIEDELTASGWQCVFRDVLKDGRVKTSFLPGEPRSRFESDSFSETCSNCGKGIGRHVDDDDRPVRRNYCYRRGEEKTSKTVDT